MKNSFSIRPKWYFRMRISRPSATKGLQKSHFFHVVALPHAKIDFRVRALKPSTRKNNKIAKKKNKNQNPSLGTLIQQQPPLPSCPRPAAVVPAVTGDGSSRLSPGWQRIQRCRCWETAATTAAAVVVPAITGDRSALPAVAGRPPPPPSPMPPPPL